MSRKEEGGREEQPNWFETRSRNEVVEMIKGKRRSTFRRHQTDFFHLQVFFCVFYCMIEQGVKNVFKVTKKKAKLDYEHIGRWHKSIWPRHTSEWKSTYSRFRFIQHHVGVR
jgi:hypothetical protein